MPGVAYQKSANFSGNQFSIGKTVNLSGDLGATPVQVAAQPGTLAVRTNATDGSLTMTNSGHGITNGAKLDIYWQVAGVWNVAYGATVGTVSGTTVPFTGAAGTALPTVSSAVVAQVPFSTTVISTNKTNIRLVGMIAGGAVSNYVVLTSGPAVILQKLVVANSPYLWLDENADQSGNPISAGTIATITVSHGDVSNTFTPVLSLGY